MWSCKRQTIGEGELQRHLPFLASREIVGEIEVHRISLVGRQWDALAIELHLRIHQRETDPGICARYKLAIELEVQACRMAATLVLTIVNHLHIAHGVRHQIVQSLVICLCRELISLVVQREAMVVAGNEVDASLTLDLLVERCHGDAVDGGCISKFLEEWSLIVEACRKAERGVLVVSWNDGEGDTRTEDGFLIEVPVAHAHTIVQGVMGLTMSRAVGCATRKSVSILNVCLYTVGVQLVSGLHRINHVEVLAVVRDAVSSRISHLVFDGVLFDMFSLEGECCLHIMFLCLVLQHQLAAHHSG